MQAINIASYTIWNQPCQSTPKIPQDFSQIINLSSAQMSSGEGGGGWLSGVIEGTVVRLL